jgi:hypothetical protein
MLHGLLHAKIPYFRSKTLVYVKTIHFACTPQPTSGIPHLKPDTAKNIPLTAIPAALCRLCLRFRQ